MTISKMVVRYEVELCAFQSMVKPSAASSQSTLCIRCDSMASLLTRENVKAAIYHHWV
jgi:hypothetical protein